MDRDYCILREIYRWRFLLSRHIMDLCGFSGQRATDRRLKILLEAGYIERNKILYGIPSLYRLSYKGKILIGVNKRIEKNNIEKIPHDIAVLDTVCYFLKKYQLKTSDVTSEKELHSADGFGRRSHKPDFVISLNEKSYAFEVELTLKSKDRLTSNVKDNYRNYDKQIWIVPKEQMRIIKLLKEFQKSYDGMEILSLKDYIKGMLKNKINTPIKNPSNMV